MPEQSDDERYALNNARREAERLSIENQAIIVGVFRMSNGRIVARTGDRHMVPGVRIEQYVRGARVDL